MLRLELERHWLEQSRDYAFRVVDNYQAGRNEASRLCGFNKRRIDGNVIEQCNGRVAEIAGALALNIDPQSLNWSEHPDDGADFIKNGLRVDVKSSSVANAHFLIWPASKVDLYREKKFDLLLFVWNEVDTEQWATGVCEIRGWTSKDCFTNEHTVSPGDKAFIAGTMLMHERRLWPVQEIIDGDLGFLAKRFDRTVEYVKGEWP